MKPKPDFEKLGINARKAGLVPVSSLAELSWLKKWLAKELEIENPGVLRYMSERVILAAPLEGEVLSYLRVLGKMYIGGDKDDGKEKALDDFLTQAESSSGCKACEELYELLQNKVNAAPEKAASRSAIVELPKSNILYVVGDLHGDAHTTHLLCNYFDSRLKPESDQYEDAQVVFLGDYVNNGLRSIETLIELLQFQKKYEGRVFLLSGNHEFAETLSTAFKEFFVIHWDQWQNFSSKLSPDFKAPPNHYGHIYTDLLRRCGVRGGLQIYELFVEWGRRLPFLALSTKGVLMCHSVGSASGEMSLPTKKDFVNAKSDPRDSDEMDVYGYEEWKKRGKTIHAQMINNRLIKQHTLKHLTQLFGNTVFVVGHTHYRSGDLDQPWGNVLRNAGQEGGTLTTLCSSHPRSPDAGHYIAYELEFSRKKEERLFNRAGGAYPCIARFTAENVPLISKENVLWLHELI